LCSLNKAIQDKKSKVAGQRSSKRISAAQKTNEMPETTKEFKH